MVITSCIISDHVIQFLIKPLLRFSRKSSKHYVLQGNHPKLFIDKGAKIV